MMRISTQMMFDSGAGRIGDMQSSLHKTQQQVATGRRILAPSDDPVAAARALEVTQSQALNSRYAVNRQHATGALSEIEGVLSGVTALILDVKNAVIAAGNGTYSDTERSFQAAELNGRFEQLLGLANTRDAQGNHIFSGFQTSTPAFVRTPSGANYQGDAGQRLLQVDSSRQLALNNPGSAVFQGGGQDLFQTLNDLIVLLNTPVVTPVDAANLTSGLATGNANLDLALDNVLTVRASVGARLQELDALTNAGDDRHLQYAQVLSELQDLDYTEALTRLSQQQTTLEAAQQSFVKTASLSLFDFIR